MASRPKPGSSAASVLLITVVAGRIQEDFFFFSRGSGVISLKHRQVRYADREDDDWAAGRWTAPIERFLDNL